MTAGRAALWCAWMAYAAATANAAATFTTIHDEDGHALDPMMSSVDLIHGKIAAELPGDKGWHPVNTLPMNRLPAFTDGLGALTTLTGLLNDFPGAGQPAKRIEYDLGGAFDLSGVNIFSGNIDMPDGRIFSTTVIRYSTNNGSTFTQLGYFQSNPSGSINNSSGNPGTTINSVTKVAIVDDGGGFLATGVTHVQFDFYSVDNTGGQMRDPFDGVNPFTGVDDGLSAAFVSPLIWEIDVFGQPAAPENANFNGDSAVDGTDFVIWQRGVGKTGNAVLADGDANGDGNVDGADLTIWAGQYGNTTLVAAVPEPAAVVGAAWALLAGSAWVRRLTMRR